MSNLTRPPAPACGQDPHVRLWTREEYYRLGELDFFRGQRVELIEGRIIVVPRPTFQQFATLEKVSQVLRNTLPTGFWVRSQGPLTLSQATEPEPDVSVVVGQIKDYHDHPTTAVLIVEVSDTTLAYDRGEKASLYARAGIADYWIVNLVDRKLEVRRTPGPDAAQPYGHGYASVSELLPPATVSPLAAPQVSLAVADLIA